MKTGPMGPNSLTISEDEHDQLWVYHGVTYFHSHFLDSDSKDSTVAEKEIPQKKEPLEKASHPTPRKRRGQFLLGGPHGSKSAAPVWDDYHVHHNVSRYLGGTTLDGT